MGGKDSGQAGARSAREASASSSHHVASSYAASVSSKTSSAPFYRHFLPTQLSAISSNDPIPSLEDLTALSKHLTRLKDESSARQTRLGSRSSDPLRPIFASSANDLFCPSGSASSSYNLDAENPRQASSSTAQKQQRTWDSAHASSSNASASQTLSASPSSSAVQRKHKRERDTDGLSATSSAFVQSPAKSSLGGKSDARRKAAGGLDGGDDYSVTSTDPEWDLDEDTMPNRPGRTYKNKKRRRKDAEIDSQEDESGSEYEASTLLTSGRAGAAANNASSSSLIARAVAGAAAASGVPISNTNDSSLTGSDVGGSLNALAPKTSTHGMRLKLNPAVGTAGSASSTGLSHGTPGLHRNASDATPMSTRRNSVMPSPSPHPLFVRRAPIVYDPAPGWELPARTPQSFMPVLEKARPPRAYPTKPQEVNENFAEKDWKEKEKERDRLLERDSVGPGTPLGAGQSQVKESTVGKRGGRDLQQTPIMTFYSYADAFFKTLTEDDLAWLSSKSDDHEPFQMPALGRHYRQIWDEEDALLASGAVDAYGMPLQAHSRASSFSLSSGPIGPDSGLLKAKNGLMVESVNMRHAELDLAPPPHFRPTQLTDQHLGLESVFDARSGPLAERLVAALLPTIQENDQDEIEFYGTHDHSRSELNGNHAYQHLTNGFSHFDDEDMGDEDADGEPDLDFEAVLHDQDMVGFEERIKKELKALDVLGTDEDVDWSTRADDEISTTLRMVQRELAKQQKVNELRKSRLFEIAKDRMAYQDYINCLHSVEKEIEVGWAKRLRQIKASLGKRKKGGHAHLTAHHEEANGIASANGTPQPGGTSSIYNGPVRPQLPESLVLAMERRQMLQKAFKGMFDVDKHAWQTPTESIYSDLPLVDS